MAFINGDTNRTKVVLFKRPNVYKIKLRVYYLIFTYEENTSLYIQKESYQISA